jgi:hypothetical protein
MQSILGLAGVAGGLLILGQMAKTWTDGDEQPPPKSFEGLRWLPRDGVLSSALSELTCLFSSVDPEQTRALASYLDQIVELYTLACTGGHRPSLTAKTLSLRRAAKVLLVELCRKTREARPCQFADLDEDLRVVNKWLEDCVHNIEQESSLNRLHL